MNITRLEEAIKKKFASNWTLGASTLPYPHDPVKGVKALLDSGIGLKRLEIALAEPLGDKNSTAKELNRLKEEHDLEYSVHVPFLYDDLAHPHEPIRRVFIEEAKNTIDLAGSIGAGGVVLHPGYLFIRNTLPDVAALEPLQYTRQSYLSNSLQSLKELSDYSLGLDSKLLVENLPAGLCDEAGEVRKVISSLENAEFLMDIGHANVSGTTDDLLNLEPRFFHFNDNGGTDDSHERLGAGTVDLKHILERLKKYDADKTIIFELYSVRDVLSSLDTFVSTLGL